MCQVMQNKFSALLQIYIYIYQYYIKLKIDWNSYFEGSESTSELSVK